jgi:uncharacterized membrane protein
MRCGMIRITANSTFFLLYAGKGANPQTIIIVQILFNYYILKIINFYLNNYIFSQMISDYFIKLILFAKL